jgi:heme-degrading monooxygenase HmoA
MHARVATFQGSPDRIDEVIRLSREQLLPPIQRMAGFRQIYGLADRASGRIVSVSLWESEQALRDSEGPTDGLRQQAGQAAGASAAPTVASYEVVHQAEATDDAGGGAGGGELVARYTMGQAAPGRIDDLVRHVREENAPAMQRHAGFVRAYYGADRRSGRVMALSLWRSREALQQAEATLDQGRERATQVAGSQAPATSEVYEVAIRA